jgi:hypothetical protein
MRLQYIFQNVVIPLVCVAGSTNAVSLRRNFTHLNPDAFATYNPVDTYDYTNFFSAFQFITGPDPTHGFVNYVNQATAQNTGLINTNNNQVYVGVDHTTAYPSNGRNSVRLSSNKAYTHGLFIADISHMPGGICGTWPAFWLFGPNWPSNGEIDIIEGVNAQSTDSITLHTSSDCVINNAGSQSGTTTLTADCNTGNANTGCGVSTTTTNAYGTGFNNVGGGVYAMQWESSGIYVWFFQRGQIPSDITNGRPVTGNWGTPVVAFNGNAGCNIDAHFSNNNIIFDTTFCGDWAGSVWGSSSCASLASSCQNYVAENPGAFTNAYWAINSVKVYQQ